MNFCDLHTHSYYSDGTASPAEIIDQAVGMGLSAIALTDHNTIAGLNAFTEAAGGKVIRAIPGVEISSGYEGRELHIVGLFLKPEMYGQVTAFTEVINTRKEESNLRLIDALHAHGYVLDYEEIRAAHQGNINRAVIASEMLKKGYISEIKEAFRGILSARNGVYVPPERIPSLEVIDFLRSIGAVPVLAHPYLNLKEEELQVFLPQAKAVGLAAMETRYSTYTPETTENAIRMAQLHGLLESGGSDYHGSNKPDIAIGTGRGNLCVPARLAEQLEGLR